MTHETIAGLGFKCDCPKKFKAPISRSYWRDVEAEIKRINAIKETDEKVAEITSLINYVKTLNPVERDIYKVKIKKTLKVSNDAFKEHDQEFFSLSDIDYSWPLADILNRLFESNSGNVTCAQTVFRWFKDHEEARYFTDEIEQHYIYHKSKLIPMVDTSADYAALLLYHGNISLATAFGHVTLQVMNAMAQVEGKRIKKNTWLETRQADLAVYLNLKNERQELLKITPDGLSLIPNGDNADNIFMLNTSSG